MSVTFQAYKWEVEEDDETFTIFIHGLTKKSKRVCVQVPDFKPYVYLELDPNIRWTLGNLQLLYSYLSKNKVDPYKKRVVTKQKIYYLREAKFLWMAFNNTSCIKSFERLVKNSVYIDGIRIRVKLTLHEVPRKPEDCLLQLRAMRNVKPSGWITATRTTKESLLAELDEHFSISDKEVISSYTNISPADITGTTNPKILSYDIECVSADKTGNTFPDPTRKGDPIICISATIGYYQDPVESWTSFSLVNAIDGKKCPDDIPGVTISNFPNEKSLLIGWSKFITETDPDIIISYNGLSFDDNYVCTRSQKCLCMPAISKMGRLLNKKVHLGERNWSSSAYGEQKFKYMDIHGRLHIDMYPVIFKDFPNLMSYNLDYVAEYFLGEHKADLPAKEMTIKWYNGQQEDIRDIIKYCDQDTRLPFKLMKKMNSWIGLTETSNVVNVQVFDLITRGQQIRVYSQVYNLAYEMGYVCNSKWSDYQPTDAEKEFVGATVQNPRTGYWELVATYDFCLSGDTLVTVAGGVSKRIDELSSEKVLGYRDSRFDSYQIVGGLQDKGRRDTITLTLEYGKTITCTPDHKFLTSDGQWVEAQHLCGREVCCGIEYPRSSLTCDDPKLLVLVRISGYLLPNANTLWFQKLFDARALLDDIKLLDDNVSVSGYGPYRITVPDTIVDKAKFVSVLIDEKSSIDLIREFLGGLFGSTAVSCSAESITIRGIPYNYKKLVNNLSRFDITCKVVDGNLQIAQEGFAQKIGFRYNIDASYKSYIISLYPRNVDFDVFLTNLGVADWLKPGAYIVAQEALALPSFKQRVVDIRDAGVQQVYDIQVDQSHNFLANGIVAHNCSLYPTTIIAYNICFSSAVPSDENPPPEDYHDIRFETHVGCEHDTAVRKTKVANNKKICRKDNHYRFYKAHVKKGVIPKLLESLLAARKNTRKELGALKSRVDAGEFTGADLDAKQLMMAVLDKRQNGYKVSANSVSGNTPVPCLINGVFEYRTIEELASEEEWIDDNNGNQVIQPRKENVLVWSDRGWTELRYIIRHPVKEPLVRVTTHTGIVDCTKEHSLLTPDGQPVRPTELTVGDPLLHRDLPMPDDTPDIPEYRSLSDADIKVHPLHSLAEKEAFAWGLFYAEGTCGAYGAGTTAKSSWCIYNKDVALLEKTRQYLNDIEKCNFYIDDFGEYQSIRPGKQLPENYKIFYLRAKADGSYGAVKDIVKKYRALFYDQRKTKRVPQAILTSNYKIRLAFFLGYYAGDGNRHLSTGIVITNKGQIGAAGLCYLMKTLGYQVSLSYSRNTDKTDLFRLQCCTTFRNRRENSIKRMADAPQPPPIKNTAQSIIRNGVKLVPQDDNTYLYNGITIHCDRLPRQKLLDSLDAARKKSGTRGIITGYTTTGKLVTYTCATCGQTGSVELRVIHKQTPPRPFSVCQCPVEDRWINTESAVYNPPKYVEYIYDLETASHHFAAGVGSMIVHNSMYGGFGSDFSYLPYYPAAASTTAMGRFSIQQAIDFVMKDYEDAVLVYGDSVTADTPVLLLNPAGQVEILRISDLEHHIDWEEYTDFKPTFIEPIDSAIEYHVAEEGGEALMAARHMFNKDTRWSKQRKKVTGWKVWTDQGWSEIRQVIRHKTAKKIYRVTTHTGSVDVTQDHSLLTANKDPVKPVNVGIGEELLHSFPINFGEIQPLVDLQMIHDIRTKKCTKCTLEKNITDFGKVNNKYISICRSCRMKNPNEYVSQFNYFQPYVLSANEAKVWGLFMADGSCGDYHYTNSHKISWAINNSNYELLENTKLILESVEPFKFKILDTMHSSGVYKLVPVGKFSRYLCFKYFVMYDRARAKIVPQIILNAPLDIRTAFWEGYYSGDGYRKVSYVSLAAKNKITTQTLWYLIRSLDYKYVHLNTRNDKPNIFRIQAFSNQRKNPIAIKKIEHLSITEDYVYDIETDCGRFQAGIGELIVKNTDSCMLHFRNCKTLKETFELCEDLEKHINAIFPKPMYLELEKIYSKYFLLSKKRYIGYIVDKNGELLSTDKKGVVIKRRDNCGYLRDIYTVLIDMVMAKEPKWKFYRFLTEKITNLLNGNVPLEKLVITKSIKENYKSTNLPHVVVAKKMRERGKYVATGTRVRYIFVETDNKKDPQYLKAEDPDWFLKNQDTLKIDYKYYLEKQLVNPINEIFEVYFHKPKILTNLLKLINKRELTNVAEYFQPRFRIEA